MMIPTNVQASYEQKPDKAVKPVEPQQLPFDLRYFNLVTYLLTKAGWKEWIKIISLELRRLPYWCIKWYPRVRLWHYLRNNSFDNNTPYHIQYLDHLVNGGKCSGCHRKSTKE